MPRIRRPDAADGLFILGLVGRAGSGKSSVAQFLARDGAVVIEADRIGHEVTDGDPEVRAALQREYGADVYRGDGALDRARVASRVFTDAQALARLNALVHPRIVKRIHERIDRLRHEGFRGVVVVDAALMLDWKLDEACDAVLAIVAPETRQVERLVAARGWPDAEARRRLAAQRSNEDFAHAADEVIHNDGSLDALDRATGEAMSRLWPRSGRTNGDREPPC